jgi:hypothetical protein
MNAHRRTALKPALQLETLDERIAPAHLGIGAAIHAAAAQHHIAVHAQAAAHAHSGAMHASTARAAAMTSHHARLASSASNAMFPTSTGRVIGSTMPASPTSNHAAPLSPALRSAIGVHRPGPGIMRSSPTLVSRPAPTTTTTTASPTPTVTTSSTSTSPASLPANANQNLNTIYQEYL